MDHRLEGPGENGTPVPRDLPDQQAHEGDDPWEVGEGRARGNTVDTTETGEAEEDVPPTDEAGTGRQGSQQSDAVHPEHPEPEEPSG
ncbi:hypothetical protein OHT57_43190 [Streptomyces sp. NBC_00285]|uniref:hypothetical protein n=1 Tax=Streptomyces sp. NBC_00285 TaxID=2975700 RepID=UPI002E2A7D53|nr:hypothetical protein [Streptomyces sp. NBC_00285]